MLDKADPRYASLRNDLGISNYNVNIPRTWSMIPRGSQEYTSRRRKIQNTLNAVSTTKDKDDIEEILTKTICSLAPPRFRSFYSTDPTQFARAFFVVSSVGVHPRSFRTRSGIRIIRILGSPCLQSIRHYHYMLVTEFAVRLRDVVTPFSSNVTIVGTDTWKVESYIRNQADTKFNFLVDDIPDRNTYNDDYTNWVNPRCPNRYCCANKRSACSYTFEGGTLTSNIVMTHPPKILRIPRNSIPSNFEYNLNHIFPSEICAITWQPIGILVNGVRKVYQGEPAVKIKKNPTMSYTNMQTLIHQTYPQCRILIIYDRP